LIATLLLVATLSPAYSQTPIIRPRRVETKPPTSEQRNPVVTEKSPPVEDEATPEDDGELHLSSDLVLVSAVVTKVGEEKSVRNLKMADFSVFDEGSPQQIEFFGDESLPLEVAFLVDASDSLKFKQQFQHSALGVFLQGLLRPGDSAAMLWFNDRTSVAQDFTSDAGKLLNSVDRIPSGGATALYDAIVEASRRMRGRSGRRALVIFSDGRDTFSSTRLEQSLKKAQAEDVVIFGVNSSFPAWSVTPEYQANDPLEFLASETGGEDFYPSDAEDVVKTLQLLSSSLRERYVLGFYPAGPRNGRFRRISVSVAKKNVAVRARAGYYAPEK
jgi:Ca-activated chloride channel family protein